jgi:hypothetical protein
MPTLLAFGEAPNIIRLLFVNPSVPGGAITTVAQQTLTDALSLNTMSWSPSCNCLMVGTDRNALIAEYNLFHATQTGPASFQLTGPLSTGINVSSTTTASFGVNSLRFCHPVVAGGREWLAIGENVPLVPPADNKLSIYRPTSATAAPCPPPTAVITTLPPNGQVQDLQTPIVLSAAQSYAGSDSALLYEWRLVNSPFNSVAPQLSDDSQVQFTVQPDALGDYTVQLTVTEFGRTSTTTTIVRAVNQPPVIQSIVISPDPVVPGQPLTLTVNATDDQLIVSASYQMLPDGPVTAIAVPANNAGVMSAVVPLISAPIVQGSYTVLVTVSDAIGSVQQTAQFQVQNVPPVIDSANISPNAIAAGQQSMLFLTAHDDLGITSASYSIVELPNLPPTTISIAEGSTTSLNVQLPVSTSLATTPPGNYTMLVVVSDGISTTQQIITFSVFQPSQQGQIVGGGRMSMLPAKDKFNFMVSNRLGVLKGHVKVRITTGRGEGRKNRYSSFESRTITVVYIDPVDGQSAQFECTGTINGQGYYTCRVSVRDLNNNDNRQSSDHGSDAVYPTVQQGSHDEIMLSITDESTQNVVFSTNGMFQMVRKGGIEVNI